MEPTPSDPCPMAQPQTQTQTQTQTSQAAPSPVLVPPTPSSSAAPLISSSPNPNPNPQQQQQQQQVAESPDQKHDQQFSAFQNRPPALPRHWQHPPSHASPRGATAIGLPAIRPPHPNAFGYPPDPPSNSASSTLRPPILGVQTIGMIASQMQPPGNHHHRPHLSYRPHSTSVNQPSPSQNFQGQGIMRPSSMGSLSSAGTSTSQGPSSQNQTWLPSVPHGRPPMAVPQSRPPLNPQSFQQKSQMNPQLHHSMPPPSSLQQQMPSSQQQQPPTKSLNQQWEHPGQQLSAPRNSIPQSSLSPQARIQASANQKSFLTTVPQPSTLQPFTNDTVPVAEIDDSNKRIIGKRSIQELVNQIDPSEKLDPEVEDILVDIAEEFVESITTFGCSLAKHRQSSTLEAKDILLHLERNWNMTLPGFCGDEIKTFKKPVINDLHRERLTVVRKSMAVADLGNTKSSAGQASTNMKGHVAKAPPP